MSSHNWCSKWAFSKLFRLPASPATSRWQGVWQEQLIPWAWFLFLHFLFCEMSSLVIINTVGNPMRVAKAFCKSTDDGSHRCIMGREDRSTSRICVISSEDRSLPPSMMEEIQCSQPASRWLVSPLGNGVYWELSVDLFSWHVIYSTVALAG